MHQATRYGVVYPTGEGDFQDPSLSRPRSLAEKLLGFACEESTSALAQPTAAQLEDGFDADELGWKYDGERWYNRITEATTTSDPTCAPLSLPHV